MKKKLIIIVVVIIVAFAALMLLNNYKNDKKLEGGNPYDKNELYQETIDLLDDDLYGNIITADDLNEKLDKEESITVYYFSPKCSYCIQTTPVIVPLTEELDIDMYKMNLLEYPGTQGDQDIEGTPTVIHYKEGKEVGRIVGYNEKEVFEEFFNDVVLEKEVSTEDKNPYDKEDLHEETVELLSDDLYDNIITPDKLEGQIESGDAVTAYYFSPTCPYCMETTPIIVPMTEKSDIDMVKMNTLEYPDMKEYYELEGVPTIIHFKDGEEVGRLVGFNEEEEFEKFFNEVVLEK